MILFLLFILSTSSFAAPHPVAVDSVHLALEQADYARAAALLQSPQPPCPDSLAGAYRVALGLYQNGLSALSQAGHARSHPRRGLAIASKLLTLPTDSQVPQDLPTMLGDLTSDPLPPAVHSALIGWDTELQTLVKQDDSWLQRNVPPRAERQAALALAVGAKTGTASGSEGCDLTVHVHSFGGLSQQLASLALLQDAGDQTDDLQVAG